MINKLRGTIEYKKRVDKVMDYLTERQRRVLQARVEKINNTTVVVVYTHYWKEPIIGLIPIYKKHL